MVANLQLMPIDHDELERMPMHDFVVWFAGFFDGEGCLSLKTDKHYELTVTQNKDIGKRVINEIHMRLQMGTVTHRTRGRSSEEWCFHINRHDSLTWILTEIMPYLRVKCEKAKQVLQYLETHPLVKSYGEFQRWTLLDLNFLREHYPSQGATWIAKHLSRSVDSVNGMIHRLGLRITPERMSVKQSENAKHKRKS